MTNFILIGFMGSGKTTIGERLAKHLSYSFLDIDIEIERELSISIPEIFSTYGETYFRQIEREVLIKTLEKDHQVVATGGGAVLIKENRRLIKERGLSILLYAPAPIILERIKNTDRPLLQGKDPQKEIERLLSLREEAYREADLSIDTSKYSIQETIEEITKRAGEKLGRDLC